MAILLLETQRPEPALDLAAQARESLAKSLGVDHWRTAWAGVLEGAALAALKRFPEAEPLLRESYDMLHKSAGPSVAQIDMAARYLGQLQTASRPSGPIGASPPIGE
jgi:hypothetical protein